VCRVDGVLDIDGLSIEYRKIPGTKAGPTIVLLHEGLGCVSAWKDFPESLCDITGLSVFSYSRVGYGGSSPIELPKSVNFHSEEALIALPQILVAAAIGPCILIGHSDGASIATIYTGATKTSHQVKGLVLLAPHVLAENKCIVAVRRAVDSFDNGNLRSALFKLHGSNTECAFKGWSGVWTDPSFKSWNIEKYLPLISIPVLAIRGDDDPYNTPIHVERIVERVSGKVESFNLSNCAHAPHREQEGQILKLLSDFIFKIKK